MNHSDIITGSNRNKRFAVCAKIDGKPVALQVIPAMSQRCAIKAFCTGSIWSECFTMTPNTTITARIVR